MKVQGPGRPASVDPVRGTRQVEKSQDTSRSSTEHVRVSSEARALLDARAPEVPDQQRIARLRDEIRNGTFQVDAAKIAERMLEEEV